MPHPLKETFCELSTAISKKVPVAALSPDAVALSSALGLIDQTGVLRVTDEANLATLMKLASRLSFFRAHPCRAAPGAYLFLAEADPREFAMDDDGITAASVAGCGETRLSAFESCLGEAAEYLSMLERPGDIADGKEISIRDTSVPIKTTDAIRAYSVFQDTVEFLPADLCLERNGGKKDPAWRLSNGCAAGRTEQQALQAGLYELVERDAICNWWFGDTVPKLVSAEDISRFGIFELVKALRLAKPERTYRLIDIRSTIDVPVIAAFSFDSSGRGYAGGYAASFSPVLAMRSAIIEMLQMEVGQELVAAKQNLHGLESLNQADLRHKLRSRHISPNSPKLCAGETQHYRDERVSENWDEDPLEFLRQQFEGINASAWKVILTRREIGIPVVKTQVLGLKNLPPDEVIDPMKLETFSHQTIPLF